MTMERDELERRVDRALGALPTPRAPRTLRPRVLAATAPSPIAGRPWFTWPWPLQVASMAAALLVAVGVAWWWPGIVAQVYALVPDPVRTSAQYVSAAAETGSALGRVVQVTWAGVVLPMAKLVLLLTVMLCTACAVCLAALGRIAPGGVSQS